MQENELKDLIAHCKDRGGLTLSDIARWLNEHMPTVREWAVGREPRRYRRTEVLEGMRRLKKLVDTANGSVIPPAVKQYQRARYITELRDANKRLPRASVAR